MSESKHLDDLVARALAAIARDGKAALDAICAEYPDDAEKLRGRLERLLRHDLAQEFVSTEAGTVLRSRFLIEDTVGEGGMGRVLLARDLELDRQVALKRLRALADQNTSMRFERELRVVAKLRHPHIAQLHEVQEIDGGLVAVLEYVPGCDLAQLLDAVRSRSGDHLPEGPELASAWRQAAGQEPDPAVVRGGYLQFAIQCALQAAEAVQFAHQHDVVHRDIKPSNLLIESSGVVRLCDFGLAAFDDGLSVSNEQTFLGTAAYAAPEQLSGQPATQAMDIYALGATFYELVTLAQPFAATTTAELFRKVQADAPRAPRAIQAQIPRDVEAVCLKALAKRPQDRYATVAELAADLRALRDRRPVVARRPSVVARAGASMRRHAGTWAAGSVATVAVAMGGYFQTRAAGLEREAAEQVDLLRAQLEVAMGLRPLKLRHGPKLSPDLTHLLPPGPHYDCRRGRH